MYRTSPKKIIPIESFGNKNSPYYLLPFRFKKINDRMELITNEFGDFLICDIGTSERIVNRQLTNSDTIYPDLVSNFFISHSPIPALIDIMSTRYRTKKAFLNDFTSLHIIVITLRCDSRCTYCQVSRKDIDQASYDISFDDLDKAIELIFMSPSKAITVEFQGGEPLLAFDKVVYAVEKIMKTNRTHKKSISLVLCTNLLRLSEEVLTFCRDYQILVSTSLDGPEFIHNTNRPSSYCNSFKKVSKNIERCMEALGSDRVSALMTATELSLDYPVEIVNEYRNQGFRNIFLRAINPYGLSSKLRGNDRGYIKNFLEFYKAALDYIIELNRMGTYFVEDYASIILSKILTPFSVGFMDLQSPSGIISGVAVYNYDGYVYASDESRMLAEDGEYAFRLGHVQKNTYEDIFYGHKAKQISQYFANESLAGCSECAFLPYCGSDPVRNFATQGDMAGFRPTNTFCKKNMEIIRFLFEMMTEKNGITKVFWSWVNRVSL